MYSKINLWHFILGAGVVTLPALYLEQANPRWAWRYVALILLMVLVTNPDGVQAFASFVGRSVKLGGAASNES